VRGRTPPSWLAWVLLGLTVGVAVVRVVLGWRSETGDSVVFVLAETLMGVAILGFAVVGAVISARLPRNPVGWLCSGLAFLLWAGAAAGALREAGVVSSWPFGLVERLFFPAGICVAVFLFLLFPTGRPPSRRWAWLGRAAATLLLVVLCGGLLVREDADLTVELPWALTGTPGEVALALYTAGGLGLVMAWLASMASMMPRFRRAAPVEREQLRWVFLAVLLNLGQLVVRPLVPDDLGAVYAGLALVALPVSIGVAVLRYRLYEIDRIISRTVSYGILTAGLIGLYLLVVALLRPLLEPLTGSSALAVAGSTLAVAAAFNPARRRLQGVVDRRFDRARYDAGRAVDAFARRLRNQVDLDQVIAGLHETVVATVAPTRVAVWLRDVPSPRGA
jgi:hypothetical protein